MASAAVSHQHQPAAGSVMARMDRLDLVVGYLEEMRGGHSGRRSHGGGSPSSTTVSTESGTSASSVGSTPRGSGCRPAKEALEEARAKGSLVDRIAFLETRVLKMEEEMEVTSSDVRSTGSVGGDKQQQQQQRRGKAEKGKRLTRLVKSCVRGKLNTKE
uniref:Uncharacterized protein n=1 Tax=Leersia perrieri TaxID=77586 RepID=A0A0D9VWH3_9ORYZ